MDKGKILSKLEQDLSHFLIDEACKNDPKMRGSSQMYKYKGLSLDTNEKRKEAHKVLVVTMGALEAQFKIDNGDKVSGNLNPEDERLIQMWMTRSENNMPIRSIFVKHVDSKTISIIPFDLEEYYTKS